MNYRLIEKPERIYAVDADDIEICGARRPYGHEEYVVYPTVRLTKNTHQVIATTREAAEAHVRMLAELFTAAHPQQVWSPQDAQELALRAAQFDAVDCSGSRADIGGE